MRVALFIVSIAAMASAPAHAADGSGQLTNPSLEFALKLSVKDFAGATRMVAGSVGRNASNPTPSGTFAMTPAEFMGSLNKCDFFDLRGPGAAKMYRVVMTCGFNGVQFMVMDSGAQVFVSEYGPVVFAPPPPPPGWNKQSEAPK